MVKKGVLTLTLFVFFSLMIFPQVRTGNIYGKVVDEKGNPLPGVTVTLTSELTAPMTTITTEKGIFRFLSLSPGKYHVKAELTGFATILRKNLVVEVGKNLTITLKMVPETLKEEIIVEAAPPVIDTKKTTVATNLSREELQSLPTARDPWVILELAPGVAMDRQNVGGSESGQQSNFVARGVGRSGTNWNVDGVNITDQISTGASPQYYDFDSFEEIQIQTASNDITAFSGGVQINFVTKRGSNLFRGGGRTYYTSEKFQSDNTPPGMEEEDLTANKVKAIGDYGFNIGGPIIKDKVWFWLGGAYTKIDRYLITGEVQATNLYSFESKLNFSLGKHRIETFLNWTDKRVDGRLSYGPLDAWESRYKQSSPHPFWKFQDEIVVNENLFLSLKASYFAGGFKLEPIGPVGGIAIYDRKYDRYLGTYRMSDYDRPQYFGQIYGIYYKENLFGADHEIKFGTEYKYTPGRRTRIYYSQRLYYTDYEAGITKYAYIYRNSDYDYVLWRWGTFLQDTITLNKLTIIAGIRLDLQSGWANELTVDGTHVDWAGDYNLPPVHIPKTHLNFTWKTPSPRLGIIYDVSGDGKTLLKGNFAIYGTHISSYFTYYLASTYGYVQFYWTDYNQDGVVQSNEVRHRRTRDYATVVDPNELYDPNLKSPLTMEITGGIEKEIFENFGVALNLIYRKNYRDYWTIFKIIDEEGNIRLPQPDDWVIGGYIPEEYGGYPWYEYKDGIDESTIPYTYQRPDFYTRYLALEVTFRKRPSANSPLMLTGSFTWQDWRRYYPTRASYNDPTNHEPVDMLDGKYAGYTVSSSGATHASINPRWLAKIGFVYQFPYNINFGGTLVARDGYILPTYYTDYSRRRNGVDDYATVYIKPYGEDRLPTFYLLNLRLEKKFELKNRVKLYLTIDGFNIFNANTTLDQEYQVNNVLYGTPYQILNPRVFRFGIRFTF